IIHRKNNTTLPVMNPRCEGDSLVIFGISSDFNNPRIPIFYKMGRFNYIAYITIISGKIK
ncbi:MAG: hypothetical protein J6S29_06295, partial [Methanosphaera sp.]|nr:hypothetical protein [Methanosphaera sp.]